MSEPLRIAVADDEPDMRDYFVRILPRLGHRVVAVAENGRQLVEVCATAKPDLVITDIKMPEMDGIEAAVQLYTLKPVPVILVSAHQEQDLLQRQGADHILGYLIKPIKEADLNPVIALTMRRFEQFEQLRREAADLRQALEDRKLIERAKGILMKRAGLDEPSAFRRLQKTASDRNLKLVEVARSIVTAEEAFNL
ncbi:MAG: response regulator [Gemmataceae bacterium]